jgi:hypothetical protein
LTSRISAVCTGRLGSPLVMTMSMPLSEVTSEKRMEGFWIDVGASVSAGEVVFDVG